jgi:hypothetical protein
MSDPVLAAQAMPLVVNPLVPNAIGAMVDQRSQAP